MKANSCYLCGSETFEHLVTFPDDPYLKRLSGLKEPSVTYVVCRTCGFVFQNPTLEPQELDEMYGEKYRKDLPDEEFISRNTVFTDGRVRWIEEHLGPVPVLTEGGQAPGGNGSAPGKRVLDVGCGAGVLLNSFKRRGWTVKGVEPTAAYAEFGSRRFDIPITPGFFTEASFPGETFDLITLSQVLEHATDPGQMLRDCRAKLGPTGRLFVGVPTLLRPQRPIHVNTL
ncbi:MAG: methyltransferase domain-containing protein, partial [Nitrospira sp.]